MAYLCLELPDQILSTLQSRASEESRPLDDLIREILVHGHHIQPGGLYLPPEALRHLMSLSEKGAIRSPEALIRLFEQALSLHIGRRNHVHISVQEGLDLKAAAPDGDVPKLLRMWVDSWLVKSRKRRDVA